jgi:hypothetical protein
MAYSASIGERAGLRSPHEESSFAPLASPLRPIGSQMGPSSTSDARAQLHRRFTTNNIPTLSTPLSPIGQQRRQAAEPSAEFGTTAVRSGRFPWIYKRAGRVEAADGRARLVCLALFY